MLKRAPLLTSVLAGSLLLAAVQATHAAPPSGRLSYTYFLPADIEDSDGSKVVQQDLLLKLPGGFYGNPDDGAVMVQVNVAERQFSFDYAHADNEVLRVYDVSVPVRYMKNLSDGRSYSVAIVPSINSSLENLQTDDFTFSTYGTYAWTSGDNKYNVGLLYGRLLGADRLIPIGGYSYNGVENLELTLGFPATGVRYYPEKSYSYFAGIFPFGGSWHMYQNGDKDRDFFLRQTGFRVGGGVTFDIGGPWQLQFDAGQQFNQQLEIDESDGFDNKIDIENSTYIGLSLNMKGMGQ